MTLPDALDIVMEAWSDADERHYLLAWLVPVLLGDHDRLDSVIEHLWPHCADEIRAALTEYQVERAEIDAEIARDEGAL